MISAALAILETQEQRNELSEIYEHHKKTFYAIAYSKLQNRPDAEDAIQEASPWKNALSMIVTEFMWNMKLKAAYLLS